MAADELYTTSLHSDANLLSYYRLESNSNDTKSAHNGTDTNISYVTGKFGNGADFNGTTSKIDLANAFDLASDFSIACWVNLDTLVPDQAFIGNWSAGSNFIFRYELSNRLQLFNANSNGSNGKLYDGAINLAANAWYFVGVVYDNTADTATFYVGNDSGTLNSETGTKTTWGAGAKAGSAVKDIGARDGSDFLDGTLDDFSLFTRKLTSTEVTNLYNGFPVSGGFYYMSQ